MKYFFAFICSLNGGKIINDPTLTIIGIQCRSQATMQQLDCSDHALHHDHY